ncbi:MAG: sulfurtransferase [Gammaproteobacteria bacterium]|nr:sulfurtransferase [Gammaproteobacteria bacterium]
MKRSISISVVFFILFSPAIYASQMLIDIDWLIQHKNDKDIVIVDMSSDYTQYQRFHIPGARYLSYSMMNQAGKDRVSYAIQPQQLQQLLGYQGIKRDSHIIIYDDMGGLNASRFYWQLEQINHPKVSVLNGGLVSWIRQGHPVSGEIIEPRKVNYVAKNINTVNLATLDDVLKSSNSASLLDARSTEEYVGNPRYKRSGHVPGAISYSWDNSVDFDKAFTLKNKKQIASLLKQAGLSEDKNKPVIAYCRSGHRAAHAYFTLKLLGYKNIKLYDGSIAEYERTNSAPLKIGKQP